MLQLDVGVMHLCADKFFRSPLENHSVNLIAFFNIAQTPKFKAKLTKIIVCHAVINHYCNARLQAESSKVQLSEFTMFIF